MPAHSEPAGVLPAWGLAGAPVAPLGKGLINATWRVETPAGARVLQRVSRLFRPEVNRDIAVVTAHLRRKGLAAPELLPTADGRLWVEQADGVWRLMTLMPGETHDRLTSPGQARGAGAYLARFHRALADLEHRFQAQRLGVHDTARHLANLRRALAEHPDHPEHPAVARLGAEILALADTLSPLAVAPERIVHGDPKINNLLFAPGADEALCLIDLDTLGPMSLPLELGDAFRSWCNPAGEDAQAASFDLVLFKAAISGYAEVAQSWITADEVGAIVPATLTIYVELAARFAADALNESYFGWDPARFGTRSRHNQVRARSQLAAAHSLASRQAAAEQAVAAAFGR